MALVRLRVNRQKELTMNVLKQEKKLAVLAALAEGNSLRSTSRMTGVHKTTILKILNETGNKGHVFPPCSECKTKVTYRLKRKTQH
jgi:DNA invertase Pin-like site-specific DNA recombinase